MTVTFSVSGVKPASRPLPTVSVAQAVYALAGRTGPNIGHRSKKPSAPPTRAIEAHSPGPDGIVAAPFHPFAAAALRAFDGHYPLVLSPDHVWTLLAQGFANHVRVHGEELRSRVVDHRGRLVLTIRRDDFVKGDPNTPWHEVIAEFGQGITEHIGKKHDLVVADFSTTSELERTVSTLTLMDAVANYFDYRVVTMCGIPEITLLGTPEDWRSIRNRARVFHEFDLGWWVDALEIALDAFVDASQGRADAELWQSFVKMQSVSGGPYMTGWINILFPYLMDWQGRLVRNPHIRPCQRSKGEHFHGGAATRDLPGGLAAVAFVWEYLGQTIDMEFLGGFIGIEQRPDGALIPALGWAVRETGNS